MEKVFGTTSNLEVPWEEWWFTTRAESRERHSWLSRLEKTITIFEAIFLSKHGSFPWLCVEINLLLIVFLFVGDEQHYLALYS